MIAKALKIEGVPIMVFACIVVISSLATMIPLSINGLGFREGAYIWALGRYGVLRFPGQDLTSRTLKLFSERFGAIQASISGNSGHDPDVPEVGFLSNIMENGRYIGLPDAGQDWHTDMSYRDVMGFVNVLYGVTIPRRNGMVLGGTEFSNMHAAYEGLPGEIKERLRDATAVPDWLPPERRRASHENYARHLLHGDAEGRFSILAIVWDHGQQSPIHGHYCWCAVGVYQGELTERFYIVADLEREGPQSPYWAGTGSRYRTFISAPIRSTEHAFGMVTIDAPVPGSLDHQHGSTIALFAAALGILFAEAARGGMSGS